MWNMLEISFIAILVSLRYYYSYWICFHLYSFLLPFYILVKDCVNFIICSFSFSLICLYIYIYVCVCVCVGVCVCVHVYVVYEDTNLYNDMGIT